MHITWLNHPTDKSKNGSPDNVSIEAGRVAIAFGYAKGEVPRVPEPGEGLSSGQSTVMPPEVKGHQWFVTQGIGTGTWYICHKFSFSTEYFSEEPRPAAKYNCPQRVLDDFRRRKTELTPSERDAIQLEKDRNQQARNDQIPTWSRY